MTQACELEHAKVAVILPGGERTAPARILWTGLDFVLSVMGTSFARRFAVFDP
jgi:hypothetical protein